MERSSFLEGLAHSKSEPKCPLGGPAKCPSYRGPAKCLSYGGDVQVQSVGRERMVDGGWWIGGVTDTCVMAELRW